MSLLNRSSKNTLEAASASRQEHLENAASGPDAPILRYRYMVQTAPRETLERCRSEAFAQLPAERRRALRHSLEALATQPERGAVESKSSDDPHALAQLASSIEARRPGALESALSSHHPGPSTGLLPVFATAFAATAGAQAFFARVGFGNLEQSRTQNAVERDSEDAAEVDFSEEFGPSAGHGPFAGGEGFDKDDFDAEV